MTEQSPWAPPAETPKPRTHEEALREAYAEELAPDAPVEDMRTIVRAEEAPQPQPELGDVFLVKRSKGHIEAWTVQEDESTGERFLGGEKNADGMIPSRPLRPELLSDDTQRALQAELARRQAIEAARDDIDNMKYYPSQPTPMRVTTPPARPAAVIDRVPDFTPVDPERERIDNMRLERPITVINAQNEPPKPKRRGLFGLGRR